MRLLKLKTHSLILALATSSLLISPVQAADINSEGAEYVRNMFQELLDTNAKTYGSNKAEGPIIEYRGDVIVEPAGSFYSVTLPKTVVSVENNKGEKLEFHIGMITANVMPHDKPKQWKMTAAVPTPLTGYDSKGKASFKLNIGNQRTSGIWHEDLDNYVKLDSHYENITIDFENNPSAASFGSIKAVYNLDENESGFWSGPMNIFLNNFNVAPPDKDGFLKIGQVAIKTDTDKMNLSSMKKLQVLINETAQRMEETPSYKPDVNEIIDILLSLLNGFESNFELSNLHFQNGENDEMNAILDMGLKSDDKNKKKNQKISFDKLYFGMSANGIQEDKLSLGYKIGYENFVSSDNDPTLKPIMATDASLTLHSKNIPIKQLLTMYRNSSQDPNGLNPMMLMIKLPAILSTAATRIETDINASNSNWSADLDGHAQADINAANSATALVTLKLKNLQFVIDTLRSLTSNETDPEKQAEHKSAVANLQKISDLAIIENDASGAPIHSYKLEVTQTGEILLNGKPAMAAMQGIQIPTNLF